MNLFFHPRILGLFTLAFGLVGCSGDATKSDAVGSNPPDVLKPITETHIHLWDIERPIPWPNESFGSLYRTVLPADWDAVARPLGITSTHIIEASNVADDNAWVLATTKGNAHYRSFSPQLEIGSATFEADLDALAADSRVVGIRGFLWSPTLDVSDTQVAHCQLLADRGMTLDIISRGDLNPKALVAQLADAVPTLRIIIDHLGGAKGVDPDPAWVADMALLASCPNIHMKFSSFFDMHNPNGGEAEPWDAPTDLASYQPHFDVLMEKFGASRLIYGSNWPVVEQGGSIEDHIAVAEAFLAQFPDGIRDQVMSTNALDFYSRHMP
ncbi:amidohydrolase [Opitutaceae bacterium]|nr:amidohydrolase [Opitutaceae bacterium]